MASLKGGKRLLTALILLAALGIEGDYEGIGHCILGYEAVPCKPAAPRKANYVCRAE